jgi:hypothetical protein
LQKLDGNDVIAAVAKYLLILLICPGFSSTSFEIMKFYIETQDMLKKKNSFLGKGKWTGKLLRVFRDICVYLKSKTAFCFDRMSRVEMLLTSSASSAPPPRPSAVSF